MARKKKNRPQPVQEVPKRVATPVYQTLSVAPVIRRINDIGTWKSAIRSADIGIRWPLYDLYEEILIDGTVSDAISKRIEAITDCDINFTVDGKNIEEMEALIDSLAFERLLEDIMWSRFWGVSVDEFTFMPAFDFNSIPRKHIRPKEKVIVRQQMDSYGISYLNDPMIIQWGRDEDLGLLMKVAPYVIYKRGGFGDWAQFVELFGMPQRIGKYNSMDDASRRLLIQAFESAGSASYLVVPKESEIETSMMSGSANGQLYDDFRQACNEEILITILGQTMTTKDGASLSQSQVHLAVQEKKHRSDRRFVIRMLNTWLLPLLEARGYPVKGGKFTFVDKKDEITVSDLSTLSTILPIPQRWAYDKFGIPQPEKGEALLGLSRQEQPEQQQKEPEKDLEEDTAVRNSDEGFFLRLKRFFGLAPTGTGGAGIIRMSDDDDLNLRIIKAVWNGEDFFVPELFDYFSTSFLKAVQTSFKRVENADKELGVGFMYNAPDDVFRTAMETNLFHFSAAKTLAEIQELNRILRESRNYEDYRRKAESVAVAFNERWQKTEYDTAVLTAEASSNYRRLRGQKKIFPFWQYLTVGDEKVREQHRLLHGVILEENDKLWDEIYPPNGWNCRCRVRGLMKHQVAGINKDEHRKRVLDYFKTTEWKMAQKQGWGVNRCDSAQVFTADQMYIRKFPDHSSSYIRKLTAERWGLLTVPQMKNSAKSIMPPKVDRDENQVWDELAMDNRIVFTDYQGRKVVLYRKQFKSHTTDKGSDNRIVLWDALLDTLQNPDEVWLNNEIAKNALQKSEQLDTFCLLKFYKDEVVAVNYRIEGEELVLKTWYVMQTHIQKMTNGQMKKTIWDKRRFGLLIKKR